VSSPPLNVDHVRPFLRPGDVIRHHFWGQLDVCPSARLARFLTSPFLRRRLVVVTDHAVVVLATLRLVNTAPIGVVSRLTRDSISAAQLKGRWSRVKVGAEELWVDRHSYDAVRSSGDVHHAPEAWEPIGPEGRFHPVLASNIFLTVGLLASLVGVVDIFTARNEEYRFVGAAVAFAGVLLVSAGLVVVSDRHCRHTGRRLAVPACVATVTTMSALATSAFRYKNWTWLVWVALGVLVVVAAAQTPPSEPEPAVDETGSDPPTRRPVVNRLTTVGISAGFLLSAIQFLYTTGYRPGQEGAALNITIGVKDLGPRAPSDPMHAFSASMTVENKSSTRVQVVASQYLLRGIKVEATPDPDFPTRVANAKDAPVPVTDRAVRRYGEVLAMDDAVPDGYYFEPQERFSTELSLVVPESDLRDTSVLHFGVKLWVAKGTRVGALSEPTFLTPRDPALRDRLVVEELPLDTLSVIHWAVAGRHSIGVLKWREMVDPQNPAEPAVDVCVHRRSHKVPEHVCTGFNTPYETLRRFYGVVNAESAYELPLVIPAPAPAKPTP
jgi:hypothetical protein